MKKVVSYLRVSTDKQGKSGLGIEAQREAVSRWLPAGHAVYKEFVECESGRRDTRPELAKALDACRLYKATLAVAKCDRLTRSTAFLENFLKEVDGGGFEVAFCDMPQAMETHSGLTMLRMMAVVAQWEAEAISTRTKAAMAAKKAQGHVFPGRPGHKMPPEIQQAGPKARSDRANKRALLYKPVLDEIGDKTLQQVADELNDRQVSTPSGRGLWSSSAVLRLKRRLNDGR